MENQFYRIQAAPKAVIEFYVCATNEINPYRETRELGIVVIQEQLQIDATLDEKSLDSLIKFLSDCKEYIKKYNGHSTETA